MTAMLRTTLSIGAVLGIILVMIAWMQYRLVVLDHAVELYAALMVAVGIGVGIWAGRKVGERREARAAAQVTMADVVPTGVIVRDLVEPLSERELDVLALMAKGCTNQEIADRLFVSINTVKTHVSNVYGKLGVRRRTEAVLAARHHGLLTDAVAATPPTGEPGG